MSDSNDDRHVQLMRSAIAVGYMNLGQTWPNPSVGALVADTAGNILGRVCTGCGGRPHAEANLINMLGSSCKGATLYVSLEPCSHFGKTPPCVDQIIDAGIKRVFIAAYDKDKRVRGRGISRLISAGIKVKVLEDSTAFELNKGHFFHKVLGRPHVTLKLAVSADGYIAGLGGKRVQISGIESQEFVHYLRARSDAILIGQNTALNDKPSLSSRLLGLEDKSPLRVVMAERAQDVILSLASTGQQTWIFSGHEVIESFPLVTVFTDVKPVNNKFNPLQVLYILAKKGITRLFLEGGAELAGSFLSLNLVDRLVLINSCISLKGGVSSGLGLEQEFPKRYGLELVDEYKLFQDKVSIYDNIKNIRNLELI